MKLVKSNDLTLIDESFNVMEEFQKKLDICSNDEPLYLCNISDIIEKCAIWLSCMPRITPHYAVKCNDSPIVIQTLKKFGVRFDCASKGEIKKILDFGISPDSIIFANPAKPSSHIHYAEKSGIKRMTVDSDCELYKIKKTFPLAELILRIRCDAKEAQCPLGIKYGCDPEFEAPDLIRLAKELDLNMIGISFHVGSGCLDTPVYAKAIGICRKLFDLAAMIGFEFNLLDIGGGFPGDTNTDLRPIADVINNSIDAYFPPHTNVDIIAEPGRFFVASAYTLATRIHSKRRIYRNGNLENVMYFINDGVYGSFNCNLYDHKIVYPLTMKDNHETKVRSSVWGPTCDGLDQVCENVLLPDLDVDDVIIFENMGAYTIPIASEFNGFPLPKVEYYIERKHLEDIISATSSHEYILLSGN